ncbi:hypothetical protein [Kaistella jeonii]|uniref:Uncharacterized protein n=1 Tax=Kaistella jeonii TaxID=266749 RepID=A0A0C1FQU1_9FLAO|nr:hypothetical protein [Kaistella jeonii]KIA90254.1 hypothetical protein OA86_06150 [Kaistella jeonii]SFB76860.1 hypothetical protein SAMN05421876_10251 [Kaistella jeonii]VEI96453.1 Uncharacterised protein [Kaistella jeonii]
MKKLFLTTLLAISVSTFAQTAFDKVMTEKITKMEQAQTPEELTALSNDFARIGDKEKTQWLPYYYAAHSSIEKGRKLMRTGKLTELDAIAAEAQTNLDKASALSKDNAENMILQKMIHSMKMMVDPQARFMSEGMLAADALSKAAKLDPENPRISLLQAEDTYFTPEQFGGSKTKGLELFQKSLDQFKVYKPKTTLDPTWGKGEAEYFLASKP